MVKHEEMKKCRVMKVESEESWNFFITRGCPIAVHFTASWCMPSVAMNCSFEELALSYQDILFLTVDVDEVKGVAAKMEVKAMPTFVLMSKGCVVDKVVGANPDEINKRLAQFIYSIRSSKT
ncbi:thioredoxin-like protein CXXS1 [Mercurialis annua]|uniref:thioredoxin-like protein CXXS1 n=1 Tax=Mercurialis annua TaxID=3986 RepID=UPI002160CC64|nr:thioredoxin-like protein CXXS1 [Mercurialis annua]